MVVDATREERILEVFDHFKRALKNCGRDVALAKNTNPKKTYAWRYLDNFLKRFDALELGDDALECTVSAIVHHAKRHGLLHRGIAILDQKDIIKIARAKLEREVQGESEAIRTIIESHNFIQRLYTTDKGNMTLHQFLTYKKNPLAYANVTRWFQANEIAAGYIAVSRSCKKAIGMLPKSELELFPSAMAMLKTRLLLTSNKKNQESLKQALGSDFYEG